MRKEVFEKTKLTASAGIAANRVSLVPVNDYTSDLCARRCLLRCVPQFIYADESTIKIHSCSLDMFR